VDRSFIRGEPISFCDRQLAVAYSLPDGLCLMTFASVDAGPMPRRRCLRRFMSA
jgi:hypothetical protein